MLATQQPGDQVFQGKNLRAGDVTTLTAKDVRGIRGVSVRSSPSQAGRSTGSRSGRSPDHARPPIPSRLSLRASASGSRSSGASTITRTP